MSSKVMLPDDPRLATAVKWRQVGPRGATASDAQPDFHLQLGQVQRESEQRIQEAHAAGMREGEAAGRVRAAAEVQPVIDRLARSIDDLAGLRARLRSEAEADLVKLSLAIARRVLRRELAIDPEALHGLVLSALEKLQG
jgi:flagellar assembly protein FliH